MEATTAAAAAWYDAGASCESQVVRRSLSSTRSSEMPSSNSHNGSRRLRPRLLSGSSWKDPERICQYVALCLLYLIGLICFHKYTGLLDPEPSPPSPSVQRVYSSEEARRFLSKKASSLLPSPLFRHLLSDDSASGSSGAAANSTEESDPLFPTDLFTVPELRQGWVALYIIGLIYMFVALAIVCDEFFVPSLDVIIDVIGCSEDVAGATFMAAGGSAPELFTSVIGVFVAFSDVGIGTIVGSAVFNILFVIGMCALFSKTVLHLTWWPLFRDCTFYSISLLTLIIFFVDEKINWWEALLLLMIYISYVIFMKINMKAERFVKKLLYKNKVTRVRSTDHLVPSAGATGAAMSGVIASEGNRGHTSIPVLHAGSHFRHGLLQLMIHTIDPLHDGKVDEKATQLHAIASLKVLLDATKPQDGANGNAAGGQDGIVVGGAENGHDSGRASQGTEVTHVDAFTNADQLSQTGQQNGIAIVQTNGASGAAAAGGAAGGGGGGGGAAGAGAAADPGAGSEEDENQPLDLSWPESWRERITYLLVLPIIIPLWLTLPDTRKQSARKFYPITFIGSILWIAAFSYLMVWWATVTGNAFGIPPEVMGLTFLAAGTSIPDLITSVIVARKGFGDMAVSSSVGSNIFDVTVGLPLPWLLYTLGFQKPVPVSAKGMVCSIAILFGMLMLVFFSILLFNWKMTKGMGFSMFIFYFIFVAVSLGFEYDFYDCPI